MKDRRIMLKTMLVALAAGASARKAHSRAQVVHKQLLDGKLDGLEASFVELTVPPDHPSRPHRHPGPVLGYVIEGKFRFGIEGEPERVLSAGETFYEPDGVVHTMMSGAEGETARVLAIVIGEPGRAIAEEA